MELTRKERLSAMRKRWFSESMYVDFPSLGLSIEEPQTRAEYVSSHRMIFADADANLEHFGVANPEEVLSSLSKLFESAESGIVDPKVLKDASVIFAVLREDNASLMKQYDQDSRRRDDQLHASYQADDLATIECQGLLNELAAELGVSLPTKTPRRRD